jgi:hypothetical protein
MAILPRIKKLINKSRIHISDSIFFFFLKLQNHYIFLNQQSVYMFRPIGSKRVPQAKIKQFWTDFDAGKKEHGIFVTKKDGSTRIKPRPPYFHVDSPWKRKPVTVTQGVLGTVRTFLSVDNLRMFVNRVNRTNKLAKTQFQHFILQPTEILAIDRKNLRILERAYPATVLDNAINLKSTKEETRYSWILKRKLKGLPRAKLQKIKIAIETGYKEYRKTLLKENIMTDFESPNILVIDFDLKTMKPILAQIDHGGSRQIW